MKTSTPIYIINLKRNPERRFFMQRQLDAFNLNYQFVDAIDKFDIKSFQHRTQIAHSLSIDPSALEHKYSKIAHREKSNKKSKDDASGQIACLLSHIKTWNLIIKNNETTACVLEDDATLLPSFANILNTATKLEWDILLLNSQPSSFNKNLLPHNCITRVRIFDKNLLFIHKRTENYNSKEKECRILCLLEAYGFNPRLYSAQAKMIAGILQEYNTKCAKILDNIAPDNCRLSVVKHTHYATYRTLRRNIKLYTYIRLGALPEKSSLKPISDAHSIAEPRHCPFSTTAYLIKQSAAIQWKQQALAENSLVIDEIPWQLYRYQQVKLRLITPPCATGTYHYLIFSVNRK